MSGIFGPIIDYVKATTLGKKLSDAVGVTILAAIFGAGYMLYLDHSDIRRTLKARVLLVRIDRLEAERELARCFHSMKADAVIVLDIKLDINEAKVMAFRAIDEKAAKTIADRYLKPEKFVRPDGEGALFTSSLLEGVVFHGQLPEGYVAAVPIPPKHGSALVGAVVCFFRTKPPETVLVNAESVATALATKLSY